MADKFHENEHRSLLEYYGFDELTHHLNFQSATSTVTFSIFSDTSISSLIGITFDILNDERSVGEDLLLSVDWQRTIVYYNEIYAY